MIKTRTITDSGIELHNLQYNDENLLSIRRRYKLGVKARVKVKYDPSDLSIIWVQDTFRKTYSPVRAISQSYTQGLNLWAHQAICRYAREQLELDLDTASLALAKEEIWIKASEEWHLTKRTGSRQKLARFFNVGQDDHGQIIEQETSSPDVELPERLVSTSDPIPPVPAEHHANKISATDSYNGTHIESNAAINEDIGKGDFVTDRPKKKRKTKPTKVVDGKNGDGIVEEQQSNPVAPVLVTKKEPDLSGWGISFMKK